MHQRKTIAVRNFIWENIDTTKRLDCVSRCDFENLKMMDKTATTKRT